MLLKVRELSTLALLILVIAVTAIKEPRFLGSGSVESVLLWIPLLAVVGIGQMMVIVTRGIDVSVGSMVGLTAMAAGMVFRSSPGLPVPVVTLIAIAVGLAAGAINGGLIAYAKIPPIITTLGTLSAFRGLVFILSSGKQVDSNDLPDALANWTLHGPVTIFGVNLSWLFVISLVVMGVFAWVLKQTRFGRNVFAFGSNPNAARLRGVNTAKTEFWVYALTGALCGLGGVMYASRFAFVNPASAGQGLELVIIAAVVIGGTNIIGGSGSVLGILLGCTLLGTINVALSVTKVDATWQSMIYGLVILVAVVIDAALRKRMVAT
ncbi:ABC transporter permease [soil metagenome]